MGIMDKLFGPAAPVANAGGNGTPVNGQPTQQTSNAGPAVSGAQQPLLPASNTQQNPATANSGVADSPLDKFKTLWETPVDAEGKPVAPAPDALAANIFNFDPAKIKEQSKTLDFVKDVNPELVSGLVVDGSLDTGKLLELINTVQQNAFAAATLSMGQMTNQAIVANNQRVKTALPGSIRSAQLNDLPVDNPVLQHPAVQPLIKALRTTAANNAGPNANPADVAKRVDEYFLGLAEALRATTPEATATAATAAATAKANDWGNYFNN